MRVGDRRYDVTQWVSECVRHRIFAKRRPALHFAPNERSEATQNSQRSNTRNTPDDDHLSSGGFDLSLDLASQRKQGDYRMRSLHVDGCFGDVLAAATTTGTNAGGAINSRGTNEMARCSLPTRPTRTTTGCGVWTQKGAA